jgi:hypothetical protein
MLWKYESIIEWVEAYNVKRSYKTIMLDIVHCLNCI